MGWGRVIFVQMIAKKRLFDKFQGFLKKSSCKGHERRHNARKHDLLEKITHAN